MILVYDVGVERLGRVLKLCRRYLNWVQNSVFEGEISRANLMRLKKELKSLIDEERDSILIYSFRDRRQVRKESLGVVKGEPSLII